MTCTYDQAVLDRIADMRRWELANLADCSADNDQAADFLEGIADAVVEATGDVDAEDIYHGMFRGGRADEIADQAPSPYTATMWLQFVGTAAHGEDIAEFIDPVEFDFDKYARVALYVIAQRLVSALVNMIADNITDTEEN
jgi:hypothetical protein